MPAGVPIRASTVAQNIGSCAQKDRPSRINAAYCFVSDFRMKVGKKDYRVTRDDGNHFYLAGVWEPPIAEWPLAFRIITVAANAEISR